MQEPNRVNPPSVLIRARLSAHCEPHASPIKMGLRAVIFRDLVEAETAGDEARAASLRDELLGINRAD